MPVFSSPLRGLVKRLALDRTMDTVPEAPKGGGPHQLAQQQCEHTALAGTGYTEAAAGARSGVSPRTVLKAVPRVSAPAFAEAIGDPDPSPTNSSPPGPLRLQLPSLSF